MNGLKKISEAINDSEKGPKDLPFIAYQKGLELGSQAEKLLRELTVNKSPSIAFNKKPGIEQTLSDMSTLGNIQCVEKQTDKEANIVLECKSKHPRDVQITSEKEMCDKNGICELSGGDILIVDYSNKRVDLLDIQYNVVAHADLPASPTGMCAISPTEVAVTFEGTKTNMIVQFLNVKDRQIVKGRKLDFKHRCHGIAYFKNTLFITSLTALYRYTLDGQLVKKIHEDTARANTVLKCAVSADGSRLFVTNFTHNRLLTLSIDGTVLSSLDNPALLWVTGIHVSETGQLVVCGYGSHTVVQVNGVGGVVTLASKKHGPNGPESVYYSARTGSLIVGHTSNNVLVINTK